ncbi:unnamed protein product [Periconia digitata]|uniref:Uncharacterized protein n=1 Tax=Periconia digitata TaxID=1303443 RepID=A0A9W4XED2_9PLEO|nr:unnamed protein product [Periconia digitata]
MPQQPRFLPPFTIRGLACSPYLTGRTSLATSVPHQTTLPETHRFATNRFLAF